MPIRIWHITLIALTIILEARGQPTTGQELVAHTIMNRVEISGWSVEQVIYQPYQYLPWEKNVYAEGYGLRMRALTCVALGRFPHNPWCMEPMITIGSKEYWDEIYAIAEAVYEGETRLPARVYDGATHFDNPSFWPDGISPAMRSKELLGCVGDHCFYR